MEQQTTLPQQPTPQPTPPLTSGPPPAPPPPMPPITPIALLDRLKSPYGLTAGILLLLVIGSLIFATTRKPVPVPIVPTPTPPLMPTPTPVRQPSAIATQSAFLSLEASVSVLISDLNTLTLQDPSLSPPVLDLPLGFKQ